MESSLTTQLRTACTRGDLDYVKRLIKLGASCTHDSQGNTLFTFKLCHDRRGYTPLYYACENQHSDIVRYICSQDVVLSLNDIYQCVKISILEIMVHLLKKILFKDFMDRVIQEDHMDLAKLVTKNEYSQWLDVTTLYPLHYSVKLGDLRFVKFLISKVGHDKEAEDSCGNRPLHLACLSGYVEIVRYH